MAAISILPKIFAINARSLCFISKKKKKKKSGDLAFEDGFPKSRKTSAVLGEGDGQYKTLII